jgi:hypothetical protein
MYIDCYLFVVPHKKPELIMRMPRSFGQLGKYLYVKVSSMLILPGVFGGYELG